MAYGCMAPVKKPTINNAINVKERVIRKVNDLTTRVVFPSSLARKKTPEARLSRIRPRLTSMRVLIIGISEVKGLTEYNVTGADK